jgi:DNA-directed RNA polymerase specialized sigma24 family protein
MSSPGSVTCWIELLKAGDSAAAQGLWERYFAKLVVMARRKLQGMPRRVADEEDVALSAFKSFCRAAEDNRFPQLLDRQDLWQLLLMLTARKAVALRRHGRRLKRGGGNVVGESALAGAGSAAEEAALAQVVGDEPSPDFAAQVAEESRRLLDLLADEELRTVALWKLEGYTTAEIATKLGCVPRTIERRLRVIRTLWSQELCP